MSAEEALLEIDDEALHTEGFPLYPQSRTTATAAPHPLACVSVEMSAPAV